MTESTSRRTGPPVRPLRWIRPVRAAATVPPPLTGAWAPADTRLDRVQRFPLPTGHGPEDVSVLPDGRLVAGGDDGRIWCWPVDARPHSGDRPGDAPELLAETGGRPLGIEVDPGDGSLVVCDAYRGLLRVAADGRITELTAAAAGRPFALCDNAAVARDGTVYFTDSSDRYSIHTWRRDLLEHRPNGRLLAYRPGARRTDVVADGLYFPNGVALTPQEDAVLLAETATHRLLRIPLGAGDRQVLADLPAYPDNVAAVGDGTYWVALPSPRLRVLERLLPYPSLRRVAALLPERLQPQPRRYGLVALVDGAGRVLRTLHGPGGGYRMITGVRQHGAHLWLGSLTEGAVGRVSL